MLRVGVGLRQHRDTRLLQHLRLARIGRFLCEVRVRIAFQAVLVADLGASGRRFSGDVTAYFVQKTIVYRHNAVVLAGFGETTVDSRLAKNRFISMAYSRPETC
jgi:hypothetical protein